MRNKNDILKALIMSVVSWIGKDLDKQEMHINFMYCVVVKDGFMYCYIF